MLNRETKRLIGVSALMLLSCVYPGDTNAPDEASPSPIPSESPSFQSIAYGSTAAFKPANAPEPCSWTLSAFPVDAQGNDTVVDVFVDLNDYYHLDGATVARLPLSPDGTGMWYASVDESLDGDAECHHYEWYAYLFTAIDEDGHTTTALGDGLVETHNSRPTFVRASATARLTGAADDCYWELTAEVDDLDGEADVDMVAVNILDKTVASNVDVFALNREEGGHWSLRVSSGGMTYADCQAPEQFSVEFLAYDSQRGEDTWWIETVPVEEGVTD